MLDDVLSGLIGGLLAKGMSKVFPPQEKHELAHVPFDAIRQRNKWLYRGAGGALLTWFSPAAAGSRDGERERALAQRMAVWRPLRSSIPDLLRPLGGDLGVSWKTTAARIRVLCREKDGDEHICMPHDGRTYCGAGRSVACVDAQLAESRILANRPTCAFHRRRIARQPSTDAPVWHRQTSRPRVAAGS